MNSRIATAGRLLLVLTVMILCSAGLALAQGEGQERYFVPDTSVEHAGDNGARAHTNHVMFLRSNTTTYTSPWGLPPATLRHIYNLTLATPNEGSGVIAIVDAYDYPTATADFNTFSTEFGLPLASQDVCNGSKPCFTVVYASGRKPSGNCSWNQEAALDIEWAHAMAPYAQIVLVEANSSSYTDLFNAVTVAGNEVSCGSTSCSSGSSGEGEVSMSWGGSEFSTEAAYDSYLKKSGVVYVASSGDTGGVVIYPSSSPDVVAAGGTTLKFSSSTQTYATFTSEIGWSDGGGGKSKYEARPAYQNTASVLSLVGAARGTPDVSFDADPNSGVDVYDSTACEGYAGWLVFGGTSVAAPSLSGIFNSASHFYGANELPTIYSIYATPSSYAVDYRDITSGKAGSFSAGTGWDFVTGVGSPLTYNGK